MTPPRPLSGTRAGSRAGTRAATADQILSRLLVTLPLAAREESGVALEALAGELGVEPRRLVLDFAEVDGRAWYLHAGLGDQLSVGIDGDRLRAWTNGPFRRPVALTRGEVLALVLGIRSSAAPDEALALASRLVTELAAEIPGPSPERPRVAAPPDAPDTVPGKRGARGARSAEASSPEPGTASLPGDDAVGVPPAPGLGDPVRGAAAEALRTGNVLAFRYGGPGRDPQDRRLLPGLLVHAEGSWYLVGRDLDRKAPRVFRCDRILVAHVQEAEPGLPPLTREERERFEGFLHAETGRVWMPGPASGEGGGPPLARVRYSPRIAPWIREHGYATTLESSDGALQVTHGVEDPDWIVRHVLSYAGEAVVLDPPWLREEVRRAALASVQEPSHRANE